MDTSLNLANENFHLPLYPNSTQTGILHWSNQNKEQVTSANSASWN